MNCGVINGGLTYVFMTFWGKVTILFLEKASSMACTAGAKDTRR